MVTKTGTKIRRALLSVSDKTGLVDLAKALAGSGTELVATGNTAKTLIEAGLKIVPIEQITGNPEAFQGRMKTLSFAVCSGILYRRGDASDERELRDLKIPAIDCVVVNFYPFEKKSVEMAGSPSVAGEPLPKPLVESIDIGGPTMVRAAAKNAPDVLTLVDPADYPRVIEELRSTGQVSAATAYHCASRAWKRVAEYDLAISAEIERRAAGLGAGLGFGVGVVGQVGVVGASSAGGTAAGTVALRYGENPHQAARLEPEAGSPIVWRTLTKTELSYNNILDLSCAYTLAVDLERIAAGLQGAGSSAAHATIVKHGNPCGAAITTGGAEAAGRALELAWGGDPVSAFGGVVLLGRPLDAASAQWLSERFVELVAAPGLTAEDPFLAQVLAKRKNLKAVCIDRLDYQLAESRVSVPGGTLVQTPDWGVQSPVHEELRSVTRKAFPGGMADLAAFGISVAKTLKSNALALVRGDSDRGFQLVGAGQGQPNRVDALVRLAIPRACAVLAADGGGAAAKGGSVENGGSGAGSTSAVDLGQVLLVSDAFFPFRDCVDEAARAGIQWIVQPGGSLKDGESIAAADEHGISMAFTGRRHFRH